MAIESDYVCLHVAIRLSVIAKIIYAMIEPIMTTETINDAACADASLVVVVVSAIDAIVTVTVDVVGI
jgi:uncharacterized membrane protein